MQALTWNIESGSSGHIGNSNQSTSSRLGEESHFLVLSLLEIFEFDERLEIRLLIKQRKIASGNFNLKRPSAFMTQKSRQNRFRTTVGHSE